MKARLRIFDLHSEHKGVILGATFAGEVVVDLPDGTTKCAKFLMRGKVTRLDESGYVKEIDLE